MESCEFQSMSMEFFPWKWLHLFYGGDVARAKYMHLESALIFIPYGCMVDHFQHIVYDNPDLTPAERHNEWKKLEAVYRPYMNFGDVDFYASGRGWQRQLHIYHIAVKQLRLFSGIQGLSADMQSADFRFRNAKPFGHPLSKLFPAVGNRKL